MKYAILSDIHSNWEALETASAYLDREKVGEIWVLGDFIGYGANPNECFEWVSGKARVTLMGNHEQAVVDPGLRDWFNPEACTAIEWTAGVLDAKHQTKIRDLHYLHVASWATAGHGSPEKPEEFHYLFSFADARPSFQAFQTPVCFVGHTHVPSAFVESTQSASYLRPGPYELKRNERYILNPGSVGQPRDRDPRLSLGIFDDKKWTFEVVRLEYNKEKAAEKIWNAGLPRYLGQRLL